MVDIYAWELTPSYKRAVVAAGATITEDVPEGALAISRVLQVHKAGYADAVAKRYAGSKTK